MFGLSGSFSSKKTKSSDAIDKTETSFQNSLEQNLGLKSSSSATSTTGTTSSTGTSATTGTTNQNLSSTGSQQEISHTTSLPSDVQAGLAHAVLTLLGGSLDPNGGGDRSMVMASLAKLNSFDPASFLTDANTAAASAARNQIDEQTGNIFSRLGGTDRTNSMAALLSQRIRDDAAAGEAGSRAQAAATVAQILGNNASTTAGATAPFLSLLPAIASILKGSDISTTGETQKAEAQSQTGAQASQTATSEAGQQTQQSQTQTIENLVNLISSVINGTTHTVGTEKVLEPSMVPMSRVLWLT